MLGFGDIGFAALRLEIGSGLWMTCLSMGEITETDPAKWIRLFARETGVKAAIHGQPENHL
jgi:hypothetical protein